MVGIIIVLVLLILIVVLCRDVRSFLYGFAIIDIVLRIIAFVCTQIAAIDKLLGKVPDSIAAMITSESSGTLQTILLWVYVVIYILFLSYLVPAFFRKRK